MLELSLNFTIPVICDPYNHGNCSVDLHKSGLRQLILNKLNVVCSPVEVDITLTRDGTESLGFSLVGGVNSSKGNSPIYVRSIAPGGVAFEDGRLQKGDEIMKINGISLSGMCRDEVVDIIKKGVGEIVLTITPKEVML